MPLRRLYWIEAVRDPASLPVDETLGGFLFVSTVAANVPTQWAGGGCRKAVSVVWTLVVVVAT